MIKSGFVRTETARISRSTGEKFREEWIEWSMARSTPPPFEGRSDQ